MVVLRAPRGGVVAGFVGIFIVVAGCGGANPAPETTVVTSSPSSSAEPTAKVTEPVTDQTATADAIDPPVIPAAMAYGDEAGARAAADYMLEVYTYTYWSGDVGPLQAFCADVNLMCQTVVDRVGIMGKNGQFYLGGQLAWLAEPDVELVENPETPSYVIEGRVSEQENSFVSSDTVVVETHLATIYAMTLGFQYIGDRWIFAAASFENEAVIR